MSRIRKASSIVALVFACFVSINVVAELEPPCAKDSPERRGELGCSLVQTKPLPDNLGDSLLWHIDRFESGETAKAAETQTTVAIDAHGTWWTLTLEPTADNHHGGEHVAQVRLPSLPPAAKYSMLVYSAYVKAGLTSRVHVHSGVEAFYAVDGDQCLATPDRAYKMHKGDTLAVPTGVTMQLVASGTTPRRTIAIVVYDTSQPPTTRVENGPELASCN